MNDFRLDVIPFVRKRFNYGWIIVAISLLNLMTLYGVWYSFSVFMLSFSREFGWNRTVASSIFTTFTFVIGFTAPLIGFCLDRFGSRRVLSLGGLILAMGLFLCSKAESLIAFYISFGLIAGLGGSAIGLVGNSRAIANWFVRNRGLASGIATSGIGLGMLVIVPLVQAWVQEYGWRESFLILSLFSALVLIPMNAIFQRSGPGRTERGPHGGLEGEASSLDPGTAWGRKGLLDIFKTNRFRQLFFVFFTGGFIVQVVLIHQVALATDAGFSQPTIGKCLILLGFFSIFGRMIWGTLSDTIGRKKAYWFASVMLVAGLCFVLISKAHHSMLALYGYTFCFGTGYGAIAPLNWSIAADIYSGSHFGSIYGLLFIGTGVGAALGPLFGGMMFDIFSGYALAFGMAVLLLFLSNRSIDQLYQSVQRS